MTQRSARAALFAVVALVAIPFSSPASGEPYIAGFGGAAFTTNEDVDTDQELTVLGSTLKADIMWRNVRFDMSAVFGGKLGYFLEGSGLVDNLGAEVEVYHFRPDIDQRRVAFTGTLSGMPVAGTSATEADVEVTTVGFNGLFRIPLAVNPDFPKGQVQPFFGVGVGIFVANFETTLPNLAETPRSDDTDVQAGVQLIAGIRILITRNIALFGEYKFVQTGNFNFELEETGTILGFTATERLDARTDLTANMVYGGIGFHW